MRATSPTYRVPFRRRREGKTHYRRRLALLKSKKHRLVVRKTARGITVQVVGFSPEGDITFVSVNQKHLKKLGWPARRNAPTAYLSGFYAGLLAKKKGIKEVVLDIGLHTPTKGSIVFYALKGAIDAGLHSSLGMELDENRMKGKLIEEYAKSLKQSNKDRFEKQFSLYLKQGVDPTSLSSLFEQIKQKIMGGSNA